MPAVRHFWAKHRIFIVILAIYIVGGLVLLPAYRRQINPDGVAYLTIAHDYARGNFHAALNAYWAPLYSWLLAPFWLIHRDSQVGAKLIGLLSGGVVIVFSYLLFRRWQLPKSVQYLALASLVLLAWYWALPSPITPDSMVVALFVVYLWLFTKQFKNTWLKAAMLGVAGAVGFYAKAFLLPFFVAHLVITRLLEWQRTQPDARKKLVLNTAVSLGVTAVLIASWVAVLSAKYHKLTVSTAGSFNLRILDPQQSGQPVSYRGLLPLPNSQALSAWEDPTSIPTPNWNPVSSLRHLHDYWDIVVENVRVTGIIFLSFSVFSLALLAYCLLSVLGGRPKYRAEMVVLLVASLIYTAGYVLTNREERYFWPVFWALIMLGAFVAATTKIKWKTPVQYVAVALAIVSVVFMPVKQLIDNHNKALYPWQEAMALQPLIPAGSRVASDTFNTIDYCYFLQVPCYGAINPSFSTRLNEQQVAKYRITDVLMFNLSAGQSVPTYLANYHEVVSPAPSARLFVLNKS